MKDQRISNEKRNFIIAICAMLISAASFYATYLQADAANKQVKAMTLPLLQFATGNWNAELERREITFTLKNAGLGAAIIKNFHLIYNNHSYTSYSEYFKACCSQEYAQMKKLSENSEISLITSFLPNTILAGQSSNQFITLNNTQESQVFWEKVNKVRFNTQLEVCYCSLLDDCYLSNAKGVAKAVEHCPVQNN